MAKLAILRVARLAILRGAVRGWFLGRPATAEGQPVHRVVTLTAAVRALYRTRVDQFGQRPRDHPVAASVAALVGAQGHGQQLPATEIDGGGFAVLGLVERCDSHADEQAE